MRSKAVVLEPGDTAILFLRACHKEPNTFYIAYGPLGVLPVNTDRTVSLPSGMQTMPEMQDREAPALNEMLGLLRGLEVETKLSIRNSQTLWRGSRLERSHDWGGKDPR
jgi:hypothetical protein